jgi:hypothetical protein
MNTHGRALFTLAHRAMAGYDEDDYNEILCAMVLGWNLGDGHMHNQASSRRYSSGAGSSPARCGW